MFKLVKIVINCHPTNQAFQPPPSGRPVPLWSQIFPDFNHMKVDNVKKQLSCIKSKNLCFFHVHLFITNMMYRVKKIYSHWSKTITKSKKYINKELTILKSQSIIILCSKIHCHLTMLTYRPFACVVIFNFTDLTMILYLWTGTCFLKFKFSGFKIPCVVL